MTSPDRVPDKLLRVKASTSLSYGSEKVRVSHYIHIDTVLLRRLSATRLCSPYREREGEGGRDYNLHSREREREGGEERVA